MTFEKIWNNIIITMFAIAALYWYVGKPDPNRTTENLKYLEIQAVQERTKQIELLKDNPEALQAVFGVAQAESQAVSVSMSSCESESDKKRMFETQVPVVRQIGQVLVMTQGCTVVQMNSFRKLEGQGSYMILTDGYPYGVNYHKCGTINLDNDHDTCEDLLRKSVGRRVYVINQSGIVKIS